MNTVIARRMVCLAAAIAVSATAVSQAGPASNELAPLQRSHEYRYQSAGPTSCTFVESWTKQPSTKDVRALDLFGSVLCPYQASVVAWLSLYDQVHPAPRFTRYAGSETGTVSLSATYLNPKRPNYLRLNFHVAFDGNWPYPYPGQCSPPSVDLTGGGPSGDPVYFECDFNENIYIPPLLP